MPPATIRQFRAEDADACLMLIRDCVADDPDLAPDLRQALLAHESPESIRQRAALYYLAVGERDDGIAGVAGLDMNEIRLLYVAPEHQRRGLGSELLRHLETMVPAVLFSEIFVYSTPAAERFYRGHGYLRRGTQLFDVQGHSMETVLMVKTLRSA